MTLRPAPRRAATAATLAAGALLLTALGPGTGSAAASSPGATLFAPGAISSAEQNEWRITFTPDGRTTYFTRSPGSWPAAPSTILVSHRTLTGWSEPKTAPFSGVHRDIDPVISPDGRRLYFASIRPAEDGQAREDSDLWFVERRAGGWSKPKRLLGDINTPYGELYPSVDSDGTLYFGSDRPGGLGSWDLYRARLRPDGSYAPAENLGPGVNTPGLDFNPEILPDGKTLIFAAWQRPDQTGGPGAGSDIYASRAGREGNWTEPRNLGPAVNTDSWEYHPTVVPGQDRLYFVRQDPTNDFYRVRLRDLGIGC